MKVRLISNARNRLQALYSKHRVQVNIAGAVVAWLLAAALIYTLMILVIEPDPSEVSTTMEADVGGKKY